MKIYKKLLNSSLNYRTFNNCLSPRINIRYINYLKYCKRFYNEEIRSIKTEIDDFSPKVFQNLLAEEVCQGISNSITRRIDSGQEIFREPENKNFVGIKKPLTALNDQLIQIFQNKELNKSIESYFQSYYKILWMDCYRSLKTNDEKTSWLWHSDNVPPGVLKVIFLITSSDEEKGSTKFLNKSKTNEFRDVGYFGIDVKSRTNSLKNIANRYNINYNPITFLTEPGTCILFNNNNFHKASPPKKEYRDACTYFIIPSRFPWHENLKKVSIENIEESPGGFPLHPRLLEEE